MSSVLNDVIGRFNLVHGSVFCRGEVLKATFWTPWPSLASKLQSLASTLSLQKCRKCLALFFMGQKKNNQTQKFLEFWHRRSQDFWLGIPDPQITCYMTSSKFFKKGDFLWDKICWKIRSLGPGLVRKQDVAKDGGPEANLIISKYVLIFIVEA